METSYANVTDETHVKQSQVIILFIVFDILSEFCIYIIKKCQKLQTIYLFVLHNLDIPN